MVGCKGVFILLIVSSSTWAQSNRYVVFFKDKNSNPYLLSQPEGFLSPKSLKRRTHSGISLTAEDLPVTPSYLAQVKATGAKTFFTSKWMNGVLVEGSASMISSIASLPFVTKVDFVAPGKKLIGGRSKQLDRPNSRNAMGTTEAQLQMLGLDKMHQDGFYGEGVTISILDGGFQGVNSALPFQPIFAEGRVKMTQDFVTNSGNVYQFDAHGTEVFSVIAAKGEMFTGGAYKANYLLFVTEDVGSEYRIEEYNWLFAAEKADSAGTDVIQSSLGYNLFDDSQMDYKITDLNGKTAVVSKAASMARDRGIIVVVSAGNEGTSGWHFITPPADVDGILSAGAINNLGAKVGFSSFGPTSDGRVKPDVVALGQNATVILPDGTINTNSGTSFASPLVASLVAGLLQAYRSYTPAELVQAIKLSASQSKTPDNQLGYGVPNYIAVKNYLESNLSANEVFIYPNPTESTLRLAFKNLPQGQVDISFYDALGNLLSNPVTTLNWLNNPMEIPLSNLAAGSYFLKVKTATVSKTFRFVKL